MAASAVWLGLLGIGFTFFGAELAVFTGTGLSTTFTLLLQLLGALYLGFAMLNWMAQGAAIGGIYNRPAALANLAHFFIGGMALAKVLLANPGIDYAFYIMGLLYVVFALLFGWILFRSPVPQKMFARSEK